MEEYVNREELGRLAAETEKIVRAGCYWSGHEIRIAEAIAAAVAGTHVHEPDEPIARARMRSDPREPVTIEVTGETTLEATRRLAALHGDRLACLNFASATQPGGGFRSGAHAQEESLARSSALARCLESTTTFYERHRRLRDPMYTDAIICSPSVPVFRADSGELLEQPYQVSIITSAAPDLRTLRRRGRTTRVEQVLRHRGERVVQAAVAHGWSDLVLGAWGCGVFGNDPAVVARVFLAILNDKAAWDLDAVTFAVFDPDPRKRTLGAFQSVFA